MQNAGRFSLIKSLFKEELIVQQQRLKSTAACGQLSIFLFSASSNLNILKNTFIGAL